MQRADYAHIATHGYFAKEPTPLTATPVEYSLASPLDEYRFAAPFGEADRPNTRNPLVESGIALAGAKSWIQSRLSEADC